MARLQIRVGRLGIGHRPGLDPGLAGAATAGPAAGEHRNPSPSARSSRDAAEPSHGTVLPERLNRTAMALAARGRQRTGRLFNEAGPNDSKWMSAAAPPAPPARAPVTPSSPADRRHRIHGDRSPGSDAAVGGPRAPIADSPGPSIIRAGRSNSNADGPPSGSRSGSCSESGIGYSRLCAPHRRARVARIGRAHGIEDAQQWGDADPAADQHDRQGAVLSQIEVTGRGPCPDPGAFFELVVEVVRHDPRRQVRPAWGRWDPLDRHPVVIGARRSDRE